MTAFLELLSTYAIFFYIAGVVAVLFGIKMLLDARRASRTTLFTLEQEQASDRAFRALLVMLAATLFIGGVAGINAFVAPAVPTETPETIEPPTTIPFTPPVILDTATPQPTVTLPPPTAAATVQPTQGAGAAPTPPPVAQPTAPVEPTVPLVEPTPLPQPTVGLMYPAPPLNTPPDGDSIGSNRIRFSWGFNQASETMDVPELLPQDQFYRLAISFTDKTKNATSTIPLCIHETSADQRTGIDISEYRAEAVDNLFRWNVIVVQAASAEACAAGDFTALSPPSPTFRFILP